MNLEELYKPFPKDSVSWRAQSVSEKNGSALALAYIDARDVMDRLDIVVGSENWKDDYKALGSKTICTLSIKCGDEWVSKTDGAGDTSIEAEKGALSDAFKRAAVKWGIGRYLYAMEAVWVPCEFYNGKWKKWKVDPWTKVKSTDKAQFKTAAQSKASWMDIRDELGGCEDLDELAGIWKKYNIELKLFERGDPEVYRQLLEIKDECKAMLGQKEEFQEVM